MKDRINALRRELGLSQDAFGTRLGVTGASVSRWESGDRDVPNSAVLSICREFGVNETWLRTGDGEMKAAPSREAEMGRLVRELMSQRPDSFRSALITTLLRFPPDGPEWALLEDIYRKLAAEMEKTTPEP